MQEKKLLIIDDDLGFCQVLTRAFERRSLSVSHAHNRAQVENCLGQQSFNYCTLDLKLGEENGLLLIEYLLSQQPEIRILVLTGYASIATAVQAIKLGAYNYLSKPANANEMLAALDEPPLTLEQDLADSPMSVNRLEWEHIQKVLQQNDGNISATARSLGMHRRTLQRKLQKRPVKQ